MFIDDLKLMSHLRPQAPPLTLATLINCITKPLMDLGITGFRDLTSGNEKYNEKYIISGKQLRNKYTRVFKKHIIALSMLAAIANLPGTQELSPTSIAKILQERNSKQSILLNYRKINNSSFTGLRDTHINTLAHEEMPPNPANTQTQQTLPIYTTPAPQPHSATHHRHPITNNLIRSPPPTHKDPSTSNGHPNQSSVFDTPNLEPRTSPAPYIITTEPRTDTQGHVALNVPTPSFSEEITPQCTESNARPRKRTAHGNISRTELPQLQQSLATTLEGPPPSPQTETPRSQRYSQRVSNQTKRNHDSISTSPIPLPQTTAITCLSDPAPTNQLATLSQDKQAKRARHTQDTLPGTRKRTRCQTESQQHYTPLTQIIDTVALNSQIVIQPTEQLTNSQPNKCTTCSQITSHNHHATQAFIQIITPPTQQINIINPTTYHTQQPNL